MAQFEQKEQTPAARRSQGEVQLLVGEELTGRSSGAPASVEDTAAS